jgi:type I site-specific restriction endonuclease
MLGRDTRKCPEFNKPKFVGFDGFANTPLLNMRGGTAKTRKFFGELNLLIAHLNEAVAA